MKIVLDCNVVISAGLTTRGTCYSALLYAIQYHTIIVTNDILSEYRTVATREKFATVKNILLKLISIIETYAIKIEDQLIDNIILPDVNDLLYICASINSKSKFLITGNIQDFPDRIYRHVEVITPKEFLLKIPQNNIITDIVFL